MPIGGRGVVSIEPVAHEDLRKIKSVMYYVPIKGDDSIMPGHTLIERIKEGWLVHGKLYTSVCVDSCHMYGSLYALP